jgi:outer membrane protein insertion porin family
MRQRQIFKMVRVQLIGIAEKREVLPVLINVEERYDDYGAIELSVGYSTDNLLLGSVGYTNTNLFGFGTDLGLKVEYGMRIQSGTAFYRDPFLFGSSFSFMTDGFLRHQITDRLGEVSTWGLSTGVSKELWRNLMGSLRFEFRQTTHKEDLIRPPGIDEFRQIDIFTKTSGFVTSLVYDRRDNKLNPSRGFRLGSSIMWATKHLLGSDDFLKLNANGQALIPLVWGTMISLSLRYDHGIPFGGAVTLPKVERFFAGGDTTIRGFEDGRAWTERIEIPMVPYGTTSLYRMRPQGGNIRFLSNVEFQFPILKRIPLLNWPIMGAIFFDNGFVTNSWQGFDISKFRDSVGLAFLRLVSPVGLVSFEYAFPLDPDIGDQKDGRLHFNFGFIF